MNVIQRYVVTKNLGCTKWMFPRFFASLWMTFHFVFLPVSLQAQESFRAMFYNVENLFDTFDDKRKNDNEYLPKAARRWTYRRYLEKLDNIARVIFHAGTDDGVPALVGLCEVENDTCLTALVRHSLLREAGYDYIMTASPDQRGIDVALLYRPDVFRLLEKEIIRVPHRRLGKGPTRDILRVSGRIASGDTLDVFVLHKPSRAGGTKKSDSYRRTTSQLLANAVTRLSSVRSRLHVLVMGDFNDYPSDPSVTSLRKVGLHNLMNGKQGGTYRYRGDWGILDHLLVSESMLLPDAGIHTSDAHAQILRLPFLLVEDEKYGGDKPFRTYNGMEYLGGFSDHLPVCVDLFYSW